jgi:hypothetical protein
MISCPPQTTPAEQRLQPGQPLHPILHARLARRAAWPGRVRNDVWTAVTGPELKAPEIARGSASRTD